MLSSASELLQFDAKLKAEGPAKGINPADCSAVPILREKCAKRVFIFYSDVFCCELAVFLQQ